MKNPNRDFFSNLVQITVRNHAMIFDLDQQMKEVDFIENLD